MTVLQQEGKPATTAPGTEWMGDREFDAAEEENTGDPFLNYLAVVQRATRAQIGATTDGAFQQ